MWTVLAIFSSYIILLHYIEVNAQIIKLYNKLSVNTNA